MNKLCNYNIICTPSGNDYTKDDIIEEFGAFAYYPYFDKESGKEVDDWKVRVNFGKNATYATVVFVFEEDANEAMRVLSDPKNGHTFKLAKKARACREFAEIGMCKFGHTCVFEHKYHGKVHAKEAPKAFVPKL